MREQIRKKTKTTDVSERLREDIANGIFAPNEKLQMDNLKERYGVGYSPLREALSRLVTQGLVQVKEQCGFCVAPLSLEEFYDLYNVRIHIETHALTLSIEHGNNDWEAEVVACWHKYAKYLNADTHAKFNPIEWDNLQREFLFTLVKACQSPWLLKMRDMLYDQADRYRSLCLSMHYNNKEFLRKFSKDNKLLVAAVLARNKEKACQLTQKRWKNTIDIIAKALKQKLPATK
jgi:GntR family carbon starvation induced transcriptional regulator